MLTSARLQKTPVRFRPRPRTPMIAMLTLSDAATARPAAATAAADCRKLRRFTFPLLAHLTAAAINNSLPWFPPRTLGCRRLSLGKRKFRGGKHESYKIHNAGSVRLRTRRNRPCIGTEPEAHRASRNQAPRDGASPDRRASGKAA